MVTIDSSPKNTVQSTLKFLNQPLVKECIKNIAGTITFSFGLLELYETGLTLRSREISIETILNTPKMSLILSAAVSRPGVFLISTVAGYIFSKIQLERVFGTNTIFAVNPWHPRHVVSIVAVTLVLPAILQSAYKSIDAKMLQMVFNTITSRPILHLGNQLSALTLDQLNPQRPTLGNP